MRFNSSCLALAESVAQLSNRCQTLKA